MSLNKVLLIGNVGNEPNVRYIDKNIENQTKVATFPLATSERYRDRDGQVQEKTEWHNIVAWRGIADRIERYVHKGSFLYIEGHLATRRYNDSQTNVVKYITEIVVDNLQILDKRDYSSEGGQQQGYQAPAQQPQQSYQQPYQQAAPQAQSFQQPQQPAFVQPQAQAQAFQSAATNPEDLPQDDLPF